MGCWARNRLLLLRYDNNELIDSYHLNAHLGVNHAFHNDISQRYVEEQATRTWLDTLDWFERYLQA